MEGQPGEPCQSDADCCNNVDEGGPVACVLDGGLRTCKLQ
jgi:hypothetical protein